LHFSLKILSYTVFKLLIIIAEIFVVDSGGVGLPHSLGVNCSIVWCENVFRYLEPFTGGSRVWRTDGQTRQNGN